MRLSSGLLVALVVLSTMTDTLAQDVSQSDARDAHIAIENPAKLKDPQIQEAYRKVSGDMVKGYSSSRHGYARDYVRWRRYSRVPYLSATHGNRYVNSYANEAAKNYDQLQKGDKLPVGSILAKDSFTVTQEGSVFPGALFVMEKLDSI